LETSRVRDLAHRLGFFGCGLDKTGIYSNPRCEATAMAAALESTPSLL